MRRGFAIALATVGAAIILLGLLGALMSAVSAPRALSSLVLGSVLLAAGATAMRQSAPAPAASSRSAPPPPYVTPPLHEPKPGEPPVIHVGLVYPGWNWTPDNPLGGSMAWNRYRNPASWDWESHTRGELRYHAPADVSERALRKAAAKACRAARKALAFRGGVKAHGRAEPEGAGLRLTLQVDLHSMQVTDENREACLRAFDEAFRRALKLPIGTPGSPP